MSERASCATAQVAPTQASPTRIPCGRCHHNDVATRRVPLHGPGQFCSTPKCIRGHRPKQVAQAGQVRSRSSDGPIQEPPTDRFPHKRQLPVNCPPDPGGEVVTATCSSMGGLMGQWPERVAVQPRAPGAIRRLQPLFRHPTPPQYPERVDRPDMSLVTRASPFPRSVSWILRLGPWEGSHGRHGGRLPYGHLVVGHWVGPCQAHF